MTDIFRIKFNAVVADINKRYAHLRQDSSSSSEVINDVDEEDDTSNMQDEYLQNNGHVDFDGRQDERLSEVYVGNDEYEDCNENKQEDGEVYDEYVSEYVEQDDITEKINEVEKSENETQSENQSKNYVRFVRCPLFQLFSHCAF